MKYELRDRQAWGVADAVSFINQGGKRRCYAAPTGYGKSIMELAIQERLEECAIITPRVEIIRGILDKRGEEVEELSLNQVIDLGEYRHVFTPIRYRNHLRKGKRAHRRLILDEVHHANAMTYQELNVMAPDSQWLGFTATPYRGTPRSTIEFLTTWGEPVWVITLRDAIRDGFVSLPRFRVIPILDDDCIEVSNGEFRVSACDTAIATRIDAIVSLLSGTIDRPTMVALGSVEQCTMVHNACKDAGIKTAVVTGETPDHARQRAFEDTVACKRILLQIQVVGEGVDLPLRRLIDVAPTLSPVLFMQRVGRITRPSGERPEYIGLCRNMERHGYLWQGLIPDAKIREIQGAFNGKVSMRSQNIRAVGFEKIGKFRPVELPLSGGLKGSMYAFQVVQEDGIIQEYMILLHPGCVESLIASRLVSTESGWGQWQRIEEIPDLSGGIARTYPNRELTPKQSQWWLKAAERHGLDSQVMPNSKVFQVLPMLTNLRMRVGEINNPGGIGVTLQQFAHSKGTHLTTDEIREFQLLLSAESIGETDGEATFLPSTLEAFFRE